MTKLDCKLVLDGSGSYLGMQKGCYIIKNSKGEVTKYPQFEQKIGEVILKSGNSISTGALASFGFWDIDVLVMTRRGRPVALLKNLDDDSYVQTRISQYQASLDNRAYSIMRSILISKLDSQNMLLNKHGLDGYTDDYRDSIINSEELKLDLFRRRLNGIEGKHTQKYYEQIFSLIPDDIKPESRQTFMAYDGSNNIFNIGYELLSWRIHKALIKAKLEPYLGFLHSNQMGKLSLVCDFQELYRYLVDDYLLSYMKGLNEKDFIVKLEVVNYTNQYQ